MKILLTEKYKVIVSKSQTVSNSRKVIAITIQEKNKTIVYHR
jgi:hypothetical protein